MVKTYLTAEEITLMENSTTNLRDRLLLRMLFRTGCRVSEALALTVDDTDLASGTVSILHLKSRIKLCCRHCNHRLGRGHTFCPKCGREVGSAVSQTLQHHRKRTLPLDGDTVDMLGEYIRRGGPVSREGVSHIFGINRHRAWQVVRDCAIKAGLPMLTNPDTGRNHNVSPHRLRDAFAVHAVKTDDSGDGLRMLQEQLGYQSFNTTARYRKVSGEEQREWYDRLWRKR